MPVKYALADGLGAAFGQVEVGRFFASVLASNIKLRGKDVYRVGTMPRRNA